MKEKARQAAERLHNYFAGVQALDGREDAEPLYPEGYDPEEDARLVKQALEG